MKQPASEGEPKKLRRKTRPSRAATSETRSATPPPEPVSSPAPPSSPEPDLHGQIAQRAYELYVERTTRTALDDWFEAERQVRARLSK